jgi:hypothetical protein
MLLMARYGTLLGPSIPQIVRSSPALILQELGNLGTVFLGIPVAVLLGLKREAIGGAHSIAREPNVALVGDRYGMDGPEGRGVMGVFICGTVFGTIFIALLATFSAAVLHFHPFALAMASGVGSASMMTAAVASLIGMFPELETEIAAFGVASNTLSGLDGLYVSLFLALPLAEWLYRRCYKIKYGVLPEKWIGRKAAAENTGSGEAKKNSPAMPLVSQIIVLAIVGVLSLAGNFVSTKVSPLAAWQGMFILIALSVAGILLNKLFPKAPAAVFIVTLGCIITVPGLPFASVFSAAISKVNFMVLTTPILAYTGISIGKDLGIFKTTGWRIIVLTCVVFTGTFLASAVIAQVVLKLLGQI